MISFPHSSKIELLNKNWANIYWRWRCGVRFCWISR